MSLEAAIKELTEAVKANTAALSGKAPAKSTESAPSGKADKPASGKPSGKASGGKKKTTVETVAARFGAYLGGKTGTDKKTAAANVRRIVEHYEVDRVSEVDEDQFDELLAMLDKFEAGEDPFDDEDGEEDEDEGGSLM